MGGSTLFSRAFSRCCAFAFLLACPFTTSQTLLNSAQAETPIHTPPSAALNLTKKIAIIIDDLGYRQQLSQDAVNLPGAVTLSIIPYSPYAAEIAELAFNQKKEVMLHTPMSNVLDTPLDEGALTEEMGENELVATLQHSIGAVPHITGINNHMGSQLTQQRQPMEWLMRELKSQGLFFIDSRTSPDSLAWEIATEFRVPTLKRDVFLDHDPDPLAIEEQFQRLLDIATQRGQALAIAHPYPETLAFLENRLPKLSLEGYRLVPISDLLSSPAPSTKPKVKDQQWTTTLSHH